MCEEDIKSNRACVLKKKKAKTGHSRIRKESGMVSFLEFKFVRQAGAMLRKARALAKFTFFRGSGGSEDAASP
jgi:hypothetical protein